MTGPLTCGLGSTRRTLAAASLAAASALLAAACSVPLTAGAEFDPSVDFARYASFGWDEADELPTGDARLDNNPFFVERLHNAIQSALEMRGIRHDEANPDLLVHHHASVRDRVEVFAADLDRGYEPTEYGPGTTVIQWEEGTFLVDIAEAETKRILWRGWAKADIESALADPARMTRLVHDAVALMFERFPARFVMRPGR